MPYGLAGTGILRHEGSLKLQYLESISLEGKNAEVFKEHGHCHMDIFCSSSLGNPVLSNYKYFNVKIKVRVEGQLITANHVTK